MSDAILAVGAGQLAVAIAALADGALDPASTTVVLVNPAEAAEVQPQLAIAADALAQHYGLRLIHLNDVLAPFHPLGWRAADLSPAEVHAAWSSVGGPSEMDALHCFGAADAAQRGLVRVFGADRQRIVETPRAAGVSLRRRVRSGLVSGVGPGVAILCRLRGVGAGLVRARRIAGVRAELAARGVTELQRPGLIAWWSPELWRGVLAGPVPSTSVGPASSDAPPAAGSDESLADFVRRSVDRIDADPGAGLGEPKG